MTLKFKKRFYNKNWLWCYFQGIHHFDLNQLTGSDVRHFSKVWRKLKTKISNASSNIADL